MDYVIYIIYIYYIIYQLFKFYFIYVYVLKCFTVSIELQSATEDLYLSKCYIKLIKFKVLKPSC